MVSILFVCKGNICRSPMAEAIFKDLVRKKNLDSHFHIDSAGIGEWHIGKPPHKGTRDILSKSNIPSNNIKARKLVRKDIDAFDFIIVMDKKNYTSVQKLVGKTKVNLHYLAEFIIGEEHKEIADPYHTGEFKEVFTLINRACHGLLDALQLKYNI